MGTPKSPASFSNRGAAIEQAARCLLAVTRFESLTLDQLVETVGISKPVFYEHFRSKEALAIRLAQQSLREAHDKLTTLRAAGPAGAVVLTLIEWAVEQHFGQGDNGFARLPACVDDASVRIGERRWRSALESLIKSEQATKAICNTAPAQIIAGTLHSILKDTTFDRALGEGSVNLQSVKRGVSRLLLG